MFFSIVCRYLAAINHAGGERYIQYMLYMEAIICIPLLVYSINNDRSNLFLSGKQFITFVAIYMIFEGVNQIIFIGNLSYLFPDAVFWIFFISMFCFGASKNMWKSFIPVALIIISFTSFYTLYEFATLNTSYIIGQRDENSYIYQIQLGFAPATLLLVYSLLCKKKTYFTISILVFGLYFVLQFFFQKRLPLLRISLFLIVLLYIISKFSSSNQKVKTYILVITVAVVSIMLIPEEYYNATIDRFFQGGSVEQTTKTDERYLIVEKALVVTTNSLRTLLFGQGLGGYILGDFYGKFLNVNGRQVDGIAAIEVGAATIIMRYGFIFFFVLYGYITRQLVSFRKYKKNPLAIACWSYLLVFFIMSLIGESFPGVDTPLNTLLVAGSMGYLSSPQSRVNEMSFDEKNN